MAVQPSPAAAPRVLILARNDLTQDRRVLNQARSLTEAGFAVTRVGVVVRAGQACQESTPYGDILRLGAAPQRPASADAGAPASRNTGRLVRQWPWKLRLMRRVRALFPRTMMSIDIFRAHVRWNREYVRACAPLRADAVIACDFDTLSAGQWLRRKGGARVLIYDAHELWVDMYGHKRLTRFARTAAIIAEGTMARAADLCLTVGERIADVLSRRHRMPRPLVVFNGPEETIEPQFSLDAGAPVRLYFQGAYKVYGGLEEVLAAMPRLKGRAVLSLQGFGEHEAELRRLADQLSLDDCVRFLRPCAPETVVRAASAHDVGVVAIKANCLNNRLSMPNKVFTYLGAGLAILTTEETPEIAGLVREHQCGVVARAWSADCLAEALDALLQHPDRLWGLRANARAACDTYAWNRQFAPVLEFLAARLRPTPECAQ